jgi:hypothetical protein
MNTTTMSLVPVQSGWAVMLSDGRELARFTGPDARRRALRYGGAADPVLQRPRVERVREMRQERGNRHSGRDSFERDEARSSPPREP